VAFLQHITKMTESKRVKALRLMLDDLGYPNRELKLMAQVEDCTEEMLQICQWLRREVEREIDLETLFEGIDLSFEFG
jgi:hypothetical protein